MNVHDDDIGLVKRTLAGQREAFDLLVKRHWQKVFQIICRFFRDRPTVEDIAQDVFMKAYTSLRTYSQASPFANWLAVIAVRMCYRELKKQKSRRDYPESDFSTKQYALLDTICAAPNNPDSCSPEKKLLLRDIMDQVLDRLSPKERMVLMLTAVEGLSIKEAAQAMGLSQVNIKVSNFRARKRAVKALTGLSGKKESVYLKKAVTL